MSNPTDSMIGHDSFELHRCLVGLSPGFADLSSGGNDGRVTKMRNNLGVSTPRGAKDSLMHHVCLVSVAKRCMCLECVVAGICPENPGWSNVVKAGKTREDKSRDMNYLLNYVLIHSKRIG